MWPKLDRRRHVSQVVVIWLTMVILNSNIRDIILDIMMHFSTLFYFLTVTRVDTKVFYEVIHRKRNRKCTKIKSLNFSTRGINWKKNVWLILQCNFLTKILLTCTFFRALVFFFFFFHFWLILCSKKTFFQLILEERSKKYVTKMRLLMWFNSI